MNAITRALRSLMRRRTAERDMQDEFRFHLEMEARGGRIRRRGSAQGCCARCAALVVAR